MNKLTKILALVVGLTMLAGCESVYKNWLTIGGEHRPATKTGYIKGRVVDSLGRGIAGAQVSNGASVFFTSDGTSKVLPDGATDISKQGIVLSGKGEFVLTNVNAGIQYVTASFDGQTSEPARIQVLERTFNQTALNDGADPNYVGDVVIYTSGPLDTQTSALKLLQIFPDTLTATYSTTVSTDSATTSYGITSYGTGGRDVILSVAAPPNGLGVEAIRSYRIEYEGNTPAATGDFSPQLSVGPGSRTLSGPTTNVTVKRVGPSSIAFSEELATSSTRVATIKLYTTDANSQSTDTQLRLIDPSRADASATRAFEAKVTIVMSEN